MKPARPLPNLTVLIALMAMLSLVPGAADARISLPLKTGIVDGQAAIVDSAGTRVRFKAVNWFGAESGAYVVGGLDRQPLDRIARLIKSAGFTAVRLPWSNEMVESNPAVANADLAANPQLKGARALAVFDAVVTALTRQGLMIILDNHRSRGDWCCDEAHGDGLWYATGYPETAWIADWQAMVARYRSNPLVVAAELRNEIRADASMGTTPTWGTGDSATDWRLAAQRGGAAVLSINPKLLVIVGTPGYQTDLSPVRTAPVKLPVAHRLVYAAHDYAWDRSADELRDPLAFQVGSWQRWDFVREAGHDYTAPVLISEWGGCVQPDPKPCPADRAAYVQAIVTYQRAAQIDFAWWPLNGTQMQGYNRIKGAVESYGLLTPDWSAWAAPDIVTNLLQ